MSADFLPEIHNMLLSFNSQFAKNYLAIKESGALSGDEDSVLLAKCLLILTARQYRLISDEGKKLLKNLENFI